MTKVRPDISYDTLREQFLNGNWEALQRVNIATLEQHPEKGKLALLIGAAMIQAGKEEAGYVLLKRALGWGISRERLARVMISGAYNGLARAALLLDFPEQFRRILDKSADLLTSGTERRLAAHTRALLEASRLGRTGKVADNSEMALYARRILHSAKLPDSEMSDKRNVSDRSAAGKLAPALLSNPRFCRESHSRLLKHARSHPEVISEPANMIEIKSLPRSGLHYLVRNLAAAFPGTFSFCEWYQEPGCCRKMPCALTSLVLPSGGKKSKEIRPLRVVKSHDFDLQDPIYPVPPGVERVILVREPAYILASWFVLNALERHKKDLEEHHLIATRIFYRHEPQVINQAYRVLNKVYEAPGVAEISDWLAEKTAYILKFLEKWRDSASHSRVVHYRDMSGFLWELVEERMAGMDEARQQQIRATLKNSARFRQKKTPYTCRVPAISKVLKENESLFAEAAQAILDKDAGGLLSH